MYAPLIYIDEYDPLSAVLEILTGEIIKAIKGDRRLHEYFFDELALLPTVEEKTVFCRNFLRDIEQHRQWVNKNL